MAHLLGGEHLHVEFPAKIVLDDVTVGIDGGDRIGIVGRNGDGKSTLMKVLTGRLEPDAGRVTLRGGVRVGMLAQDDDLPDDETVRSAIVGDRPEHEWLGDARVRDVLDGLLRDVPLDSEVSSLSGGQRRRVGLARLLVGEWDVVALDEPTNHLDVEGIAWLRRGAPARTSKPKFRIDAATQLIEDEPPPRDNVELAKLATARLGKDVVDLLDAGVDYGSGPVLHDVEWRIAPGERTG